jgi:hypothetical protein
MEKGRIWPVFSASFRTRMKAFVYPVTPGVCQELRMGVVDHRSQSDELGMVGDHEKIQRSDQLNRLTSVGMNLLAPCEPETLFDTKPGTHQAGVEGLIGVEVGIAEQHPVRVGSADERRVDPLIRQVLIGNDTVVGMRRGWFEECREGEDGTQHRKKSGSKHQRSLRLRTVHCTRRTPRM